MELALARKMIETAIVDPCELRGIDMAFAEVIRDQEQRIAELEAYMRPSKGGELETRIEVAAEDILMVFERHGLSVINDFDKRPFGAGNSIEYGLVMNRAMTMASIRHAEALRVVAALPKQVTDLPQ